MDSLYVLNFPDTFRFACMLTGDSDQARDLAQEAFVRLAGRFFHRRAPDEFGPYFRRTIVNLHVSQLRRRRLERRFLHRVTREREPTWGTSTLEDRDRLVKALQVLGPRQRAAVVLRFCFDQSEAQVAHALNCSLPAVKHLVRRALDRLREELGGTADE